MAKSRTKQIPTFEPTATESRTGEVAPVFELEPVEIKRKASRNSVVNESRKKAKSGDGFDGDRYCTPPDILDLVNRFWPTGIGLDPCWDPDSLVEANVRVDKRTGDDGLGRSWVERLVEYQRSNGHRNYTVFVNPPHSAPAAWIKKAIEETRQAARLEVLMLIVAAPGTDYWQKHVWAEYSAIGFVGHPRIRYLKRGEQMKNSAFGIDHALLYLAGSDVRNYGVHRFKNVFQSRCAQILSF